MNQIALDFIKQREQCRLLAYQDSGGRWTVGYGATGPAIGPGTQWTQSEADADLAQKIASVATTVSMRLGGKVRLSPQQEAALLSLGYNIGASALSTSHVMAFVRAKNWLAAAKAFLAWDHVNGIEHQGLFKRRCEEAGLFLDGSA